MCVEVPGHGRFLQNGCDGCNSQGSQFDVAIVVCHSMHTHMLSRQLLYTAVTRAKHRVLLIGNKKGLAAALNNGLGYARGKWIARLDSDDTAAPNRLRLQMREVLSEGF